MLDTITAAELANLKIPPPRHIVPEILTEGLNILAGAPKTGKSYFSLGLALAVSNSGPALNHEKFIVKEPMDVLYMALEDTNYRLKKRVAHTHQPAGSRLHFATQSPRFSEGGMAGIVDFLDKHPSTGLLVIDTLAKIADPKVSGNVYEEDAALGGALHALAHAYNIAVLVVHHTRKAAHGDFLTMVSGSQGFTGTADTVMVLTRERGKSVAKLELTGRDIEEAAHPLQWDAGRGGWVFDRSGMAFKQEQDRRGGW